MANGIDGEKPPPGFTSVASATGTPLDQHARRREAAQLQVESSNRQQRGNRSGRREPVGTGLVDEDQVVGGAQRNSAATRDPPLSAELVRVDAGLQTGGESGREDPLIRRA